MNCSRRNTPKKSRPHGPSKCLVNGTSARFAARRAAAAEALEPGVVADSPDSRTNPSSGTSQNALENSPWPPLACSLPCVVVVLGVASRSNRPLTGLGYPNPLVLQDMENRSLSLEQISAKTNCRWASRKSLDVSEALICGLHGLGFFRKRKETCFGFGLEGTW